MTLADLRQEEYRQRRWTEVSFDEPRHQPRPLTPHAPLSPSEPEPTPQLEPVIEKGMAKLCAAAGCTEPLGKGRVAYHSDGCRDATRAKERANKAMRRRTVREFYALGLIDQELVLDSLTSAQNKELYFDGLKELVAENKARTSAYKGYDVGADADVVWCLVDDEVRHRLPIQAPPEAMVLGIVDDDAAPSGCRRTSLHNSSDYETAQKETAVGNLPAAV